MQHRLLAIISFVGAFAVIGPVEAQLSPGFTAGAANGYNVVVNQNTGAITACNGYFTGSGPYTPAGTCIKIGTATPTTTDPSLVITWSVGATFFVTNIFTGKIWQCDPYTSPTGSLSGTCILEHTAF